ncbi:glycosyltransferase family 2 protein [Actinoplanes xinjiangensis]|uniref:Glycosyl transferase family 2 n=1 Tax=Actinoplanes xinjiangensis TaxID=512350 RepID=A0A316F6U3_9ACTN|nr:glycosyltransferase family 2 protein [Actinoplanes xinjiangensis]PWK42568.1 glycosyl transferase family 2 [Actinoplanes xinjiangensis]GIF38129.1 transferase [Actinoplanes xinjiangensis]
MNTVSVVVPTLGRPSLAEMLRALGPLPAGMELIVVDDRADIRTPLALPTESTARVVAGRRAGPAAARNAGWRAARHEWVAFLDDDVLPESGWAWRLLGDLRDARPEVGGVQGRIRVPLPDGRRPTDWERVTAGLASGEWITADMAYRRAALSRVGGFDERLPRAFREDAELAHRIRRAGWRLRLGQRSTTHPVRPEARWVSLRVQRGNADDALLRRMYGPQWRTSLGIPPGRRHRHALITAGLATAAACTVAHLLTARRESAVTPGTGRRGSGAVPGTGSRRWSVAAALAAAGWAAGTAEFAAARIMPGPRDRREVTTMVLTSVAIPPVAIAHWVRGWFRWRGAKPLPEISPAPTRVTAPSSAVSLPDSAGDRDPDGGDARIPDGGRIAGGRAGARR